MARLATGGMAEVWRGEAHFSDGHVEEVAIKRVLPLLAKNAVFRRMLEDEARIGKLLRHPNIVRVFDAREVRSTYIMVMELVEGASLREINGRLMSGQQRTGSPAAAQPPRRGGMNMPIPGALHMAREVARALEYAHEAIDDMGRELDIVHRDVSPHNLLLDIHGRVKLMDFGLANSSANLAERDPAMIGGKFGYLSPELVIRQESTRLLDLFAVGVMLWESVTGCRLFQGNDDADTVRKVARCQVPSASAINPEVSAELEQVLAGLLARRPCDRYQSARELGADLDYLLAKQPLRAGVQDIAALVRLHRGTGFGKTTQTGTLSMPSVSPTASHVVPSPWTTRPITISGAVERMPRLSDSFVDELDALADLPTVTRR